MDALAAALAMDPLALREKNFLRRATRSPPGRSSRRSQCWPRRCAGRGRRSGAAPGQPAPHRTRRRRLVTPYGRMCWTRDSASAWVGMELDGTAVVRCAAPDVGGGQTSSLCAINAEMLGLELEQVTAVAATATSRRAPARRRPRASSSCRQRGAQRGPRGAPSSGRRGGRPAGGRARTSMLAGGQALVRGAPGRAVTLASVVRAAIGEGRPVQVLEKYDAPSAPTIDPGRARARPSTTTPSARTRSRSRSTTRPGAYAREPAGRLLRRRPDHPSPRTRRASSRAAPSRGWDTRSWKRSRSKGGVSKNRISPTTRSRPRSDAPQIRPSCWNRRRARAFRRQGARRAGHDPELGAVANAVSNALGGG